MRKSSQPKRPQPRDVAPVMNALRKHIPMDEPMMFGMRESLRHVPNFRIKAQTDEVTWCVDIYRGHFYHVTVLSTMEIHRTIPSLITYLRKMLKLK